MNKNIKYIIVLMISMLAMINTLKAAEPEKWTFYCDYELALPELFIHDYNPKIRAYVYDDLRNGKRIFMGSSIYIFNVSKSEYEKANERGTILQGGFYPNSGSFVRYAIDMNENTYTCPKVTASLNISENTITLYYGDDYTTSEKEHFAVTQGGNPVLYQKEEGPIIDTKKCRLKFNGAELSGLALLMVPHFYTEATESGKLKISVEYNEKNYSAEYDKNTNVYLSVEDSSYRAVFIFAKQNFDSFYNSALSDECETNIASHVTRIDYASYALLAKSQGTIVDQEIMSFLELNNSHTHYLITTNDYYAELQKQLQVDQTQQIQLNIKEFDKYVDTCKNMLGTKLVGYLQTGYTIIKIATIVIVIVLAMLDFAQNVLNGKEEALKIAMKWGKRLVIVIIILLLPTFIDLIGSLFGYPDIACGIK